MAGPVVADILDLVVDREPALADARLDPPAQDQVLAEDRRLEDLALGPQDAVVALPTLAVADQAGRQAADPAVEGERLGLAQVGLVEVGGAVLAAQQRVVQAAGHDHPATPRPEPAQRIVLVVPRPDRARVGDPGHRPAGHLAAADVERPVDDDVEAEPATGPELEQADSPAGPVPEGRQADAGDLVQAADPAQELGTGPGRAPQLGHRSAFRVQVGPGMGWPPGRSREAAPGRPLTEIRPSAPTAGVPDQASPMASPAFSSQSSWPRARR